jgi:DNA-binding PadR family transcriptional regulator
VTKRKVSNMLALAVLSMVNERPMHPYEISALMKQRGVSDVIKLNTGSLYSVVEALLDQGWIEPVETQREGKHPERTIYAPTEKGRAEFHAWLRTIIETPVNEFPQFTAGLSFIAHIAPSEVISLLDKRVQLLRKDVEERRAGIEMVVGKGVARVFLIEQEYKLVTAEGELNWLNQVIADIKNGSLTVMKDGEQVWLDHDPEL